MRRRGECGKFRPYALFPVTHPLRPRSSTINLNDQDYEILPAHLSISLKTTTTSVREFVPNVIEPSFGIGRILYSLLEHSFWAREADAARQVLSLPSSVAPFKVLIVPISNNKDLVNLSRELCAWWRSAFLPSLSLPTDALLLYRSPTTHQPSKCAAPVSPAALTTRAPQLASATRATTSLVLPSESPSTLPVRLALTPFFSFPFTY